MNGGAVRHHRRQRHRRWGRCGAAIRNRVCAGVGDRASQERGASASRRCLSSVSWSDEIFVVDSQSTDDTRAIAETLGATVVQFRYTGSWPKEEELGPRKTCRFETTGCCCSMRTR